MSDILDIWTLQGGKKPNELLAGMPQGSKHLSTRGPNVDIKKEASKLSVSVSNLTTWYHLSLDWSMPEEGPGWSPSSEMLSSPAFPSFSIVWKVPFMGVRRRKTFAAKTWNNLQRRKKPNELLAGMSQGSKEPWGYTPQSGYFVDYKEV